MSKQAEATDLTVAVSDERDHIRGPRTAPVTLVEYGDFECPHCGQAHVVLAELQGEMGDQFRLVFRHFPLTQVHPHAERAAEAAEAADAQGRFWEMYDALFENQEALDDESLLSYAQDLDLDMVAFERDVVGGVYTPRVREDFMSGVRSGVNGTPTFFINGQRHNGAWDVESLGAAILAELNENGAKHRHGGGRARH
jgi:protein-disulfide isomerase